MYECMHVYLLKEKRKVSKKLGYSKWIERKDNHKIMMVSSIEQYSWSFKKFKAEVAEIVFLTESNILTL